MLKQDLMPVLSVENLSVIYPMCKNRYLNALDKVSFNLYPGECIGLVGESGSGKSTLAKALLHFLPIHMGKIFMENREIANLKGEELRMNRKVMQMIFQDTISSINPRMKIYDYISEPMKNFKLCNRDSIKDEVSRLLREVGLKQDYMYRYPRQLSGGERQRVAITRAISVQPKVLICDEPTSALDVSVQAQIIALLMKLQQKTNMAYIFISHDLALVKHISHRIAVMYKGRIVEIINADKLTTCCVHPYTKALLASVFQTNYSERNYNMIGSQKHIKNHEADGGCQYYEKCWCPLEICRTISPIVRNLKHDHSVACHKAEIGDII